MEQLYQSEDGAAVAALTTVDEVAEMIGLFQSVYFSLRINGRLAGGLQLVRPSATKQLPFHRVWPELPLASNTSAHVVMLALDRSHRGAQSHFWLLCAEMWRYCWSQHITELWLEATPSTMGVYRRLGWPLQIAGDLRRHWGEDCYLCRLDLAAAAGMLVQRAVSSLRHRKVLSQLFRETDSSGLRPQCERECLTATRR
jgi:hypothetical protein